ncbi:MAG: TIGR04255 family protein [Planctomycetota bacterium]|nr:TIGR04255 family protein [Planctomycetota bacterium]
MFRKPPVVEVWIAFDFDPNENKREWDLDLVQRYVQQYVGDLPKLEAMHEKKIEFRETSPAELPKVVRHTVALKHVRISDNNKSRFLQIADDHIAYHVLKSAEGYPGYSTVRKETAGKLQDYIELFQPRGIRSTAIHYVDIIDIPRPPDGKIDMADYFVGSADLPENPFGAITDLSIQFLLQCPVDEGPLLFQLQPLPAPKESNLMRFRMDWHKQSAGVNTADLPQVFSRLDVAHEYMRQCFVASLTERTLALFEPIDED